MRQVFTVRHLETGTFLSSMDADNWTTARYAAQEFFAEDVARSYAEKFSHHGPMVVERGLPSREVSRL